MRVDIIGSGKIGTDSEIEYLRKNVKPFSQEQYKELEQNTFQSPWEKYKQYNNKKFKVLSEYFDDETREKFGNEYSVAWIDDEGDICSDRYFKIEIEGTVFTAELEELNNYYVETNQI